MLYVDIFLYRYIDILSKSDICLCICYRDLGTPQRGFGSVLPRHNPDYNKFHLESTHRADFTPPDPEYTPVPVSGHHHIICLCIYLPELKTLVLGIHQKISISLTLHIFSLKSVRFNLDWKQITLFSHAKWMNEA